MAGVEEDGVFFGGVHVAADFGAAGFVVGARFADDRLQEGVERDEFGVARLVGEEVQDVGDDVVDALGVVADFVGEEVHFRVFAHFFHEVGGALYRA